MQWYYLDENQEQKPFEEYSINGLVGSGTLRSETLVWNETLSDWTPAAKAFPERFPDGSAESEAVTSAEASLPEIADPVPHIPPASSAPPMLVQKNAKPGGVGIVKVGKLHSSGPTLNTASPAVAESAIKAASSVESVKDLASYIAASAGWLKLLGVLSIISGVVTCLTIVGLLIGWLPIWLGVILLKTASAAKFAETTGDEMALAEVQDRLRLYFKLLGIVSLLYLVFVGLYIALIFTFGLAAGLGGLKGFEGMDTVPFDSTEAPAEP